ncbi:VanZ family protein [Chlamydiota bacterium]
MDVRYNKLFWGGVFFFYQSVLLFFSTKEQIAIPFSSCFFSDKIIHFMEYLLLMVLFIHMLKSTFLLDRRWLIRIGFIYLAVISLFDETIQGTLTLHRDCSFGDWVADCLGGGLGFFFYSSVQRYFA